MTLTAADRKRIRAAADGRSESSRNRMSRMDELEQFYNVNEGSSHSKGRGVVHGIKKFLGLKAKHGMQSRRAFEVGTSLNPENPVKSKKKGGLRKI